MTKKINANNTQLLKLILTPRQYEFWEIKKNFKEIYGRDAKQSEIAVLMGVSQPSIANISRRIKQKLAKIA